MKLIVIPNFGNRVSPRIDCSENLQLVSIEDKRIISRETIRIPAHSLLERINMIIRLRPDIVICDGISTLMNDKLSENDIKVIPWIHGNIDEILNDYLNGKLNI
ncbi:MAG: hypothetical protein R3250_08305 [Melioribacteraceae bacterium]|nr:hypothetical protein [Melioribacteraceae bacterium]